MPYQLFVSTERTKRVYRNSNIQVQFCKFKSLLSQMGNVQFKGKTIKDLLQGQCYFITLSPRNLKLHHSPRSSSIKGPDINAIIIKVYALIRQWALQHLQ